eukprot:TRINITY_DN523_c0_g1_i4.p1 TRINITY_DN523_c0_g1~~TRINITY_DN523_c0_g1_i4.p1  ORF type:complete len:122 (-),score=30.95 TRINITY_DN523_c0_g1_i4:892-1257(-)
MKTKLIRKKLGDDEMEVDEEAEENKKLEREVVGVLKFRNYFPRNEVLRKCAVPPPPDISSVIQKRFDKLCFYSDDESLVVLAPKKQNWDLKRDVEDRMNLLEAQTQRAIKDLIIEKLKTKE